MSQLSKTKIVNESAFSAPSQIQHKILQNAVMQSGINAACYNQEAKNFLPHTFSVNIETGAVANQKQSGRCWIFAACNFLRHKLNAKENLKDFEISQGHLFFYDKLEKSNYFLQAIIDTVELDLDDRLVHFLLATPQQDGGQWDMVVSLIEKYGLVPKQYYPDTFNMSQSAQLNTLLNKKLRFAAEDLRTRFAKGASKEALEERKQEFLNEIYQMLCIILGTPVKSFTWEYYDKDQNFHRVENLSPKSFYDQFIGLDLSEYVSIINAPTKDKPYMRSFTVSYLGNVLGGHEVKYLNLDMPSFKALALAQLKDKESIWFGCDVGKFLDRQEGLMDVHLYNYEEAFGQSFIQSKEGALDYGESLMTHAMVLSGVNVDEAGKTTRWKIENSWGDKTGNKGYYVMSDAWMDMYTYQIVIHKKHLSAEQLKAFEAEPIVLKPWDPMGSLARCC